MKGLYTLVSGIRGRLQLRKSYIEVVELVSFLLHLAILLVG